MTPKLLATIVMHDARQWSLAPDAFMNGLQIGINMARRYPELASQLEKGCDDIIGQSADPSTDELVAIMNKALGISSKLPVDNFHSQ